MRKQLTRPEVINFIGIGFCQPKFYKRNAWLKAKEIMDFLVSLNVGVIEFDYGRGKGKYKTTKEISNIELADIYLKYIS